jgi:hypothetical protein
MDIPIDGCKLAQILGQPCNFNADGQAELLAAVREKYGAPAPIDRDEL